MASSKIIRQISATRRGSLIELTCVTEDGTTVTLLASDEQIDRLVDELDDALNSPDGPDEDS